MGAPEDTRPPVPAPAPAPGGEGEPTTCAHGLWQLLAEAGPILRRLGEPFAAMIEALGSRDRPGPESRNTDREPTETVGFTIAAIALGAKMAAVDKRRHERQISAFHEVFQVPEGEQRNVRRLFEIASASTTGYEVYARRIADLLQGRDAVKEKLLDALFHIAWGDDRIVEPELDFLRRVADIFGFDEAAFSRIAAAHGVGTPSPFVLLGVAIDAEWPVVQRAYRRLMQQHHPDHLVAQGMPRELIRLAHDRVAALTEAYESIRSMHAPRSGLSTAG